MPEYDIGPWGGQGFLRESLARVRLDVYRLLSTLFASTAFHELEHTVDVAFGRLSRDFELIEVEHGLLNIASSTRVILDSRSPRPELSAFPCGSLWKKIESDATDERTLTLREACNKIIHAETRNLDVDNYASPTGLQPFVHLYGRHFDRRWKATVEVVRFGSGVLKLTNERLFGAG